MPQRPPSTGPEAESHACVHRAASRRRDTISTIAAYLPKPTSLLLPQHADQLQTGIPG